MGQEILDGNTAVNPYKQGQRTACDYCPYHSICGFDLKTSGFGYRKFKSMKAEAIWAEIEADEESEIGVNREAADGKTQAGADETVKKKKEVR